MNYVFSCRDWSIEKFNFKIQNLLKKYTIITKLKFVINFKINNLRVYV